MSKPILLIDMDNVIVDFYSHPYLNVERDVYNHPNIYLEKYFEYLRPLENAIETVRKIIQLDKFDIYICTQPLATSPHSFSEKATWIKRWLPELESKLVMTCNKDLVDSTFLIDDSEKWREGCKGTFLHFDPLDSRLEWDAIYTVLQEF